MTMVADKVLWLLELLPLLDRGGRDFHWIGRVYVGHVTPYLKTARDLFLARGTEEKQG